MSEARTPRRIVTGVRDGRSVFLGDDEVPNCHHYQGWPGFMTSVIWATAPVPQIPLTPGDEPAPTGRDVVPGPGETRLMIVRFPPDAVFADPRFDPATLDREQAFHLNSLAATFEQDDPGMHRTNSVDYDIVLENEIWLELDDGDTRHMRQGDVAIQGGGRHAWRNKSDKPTLMCFVLIGAERSGGAN